MTTKTVTLQTHFDDKTTLFAFAKIFKVKVQNFETEVTNIYLNEQFPLEKVKQVQSLFSLRIIEGWRFCNFWDYQVGKLDKLYLNDLNLDGFGFIERDLRNADFSNSSLVRAYFRGANLENANFENTDLTNAYLMRSNLRNANFTNSILDKIQDKDANY